MKKLYLLSFMALCLAPFSLKVSAQEMLLGGNMEDEALWNVTQNVTVEGAYATVTFNYTDFIPLFGSGGAMHVTCSNTSDNNGTNVTIWQNVDLLAGHTYVIDGAFLDLAGINNYWCQVYIDTAQVIEGQDYSAESLSRVMINTWKAVGSCSENNGYAFIDVTFQNFECESGVLSDTVEISEDATYKFAVKMGLWNSVVPSTYDVVLDNLSLFDLANSSANPGTKTFSFSIQPNPVADLLNISSATALNNITIINMLGQPVLSLKNIGTGSLSLNLSGTNPGIYYMLVKDAHGDNGVKKIIKL